MRETAMRTDVRWGIIRSLSKTGLQCCPLVGGKRQPAEPYLRQLDPPI